MPSARSLFMEISGPARELNRLNRLKRPEVNRPKRRLLTQLAAISFAVGAALASIVGYFSDGREGSARRDMVYEKVTKTGRTVGRWSGRKARHQRTRTGGTVAELRSEQAAKRTETAGG